MRLLPLVAASLLLAGCGGNEEALTIYLAQRLGPEGPPGQVAPVLMPVERDRRPGMAAAWQALLELRGGPAPEERAHGFLDTLSPRTRLVSVEREGRLAVVELAGAEPDLRGAAAIVYSLTELPGVDRVRLRLGGRGCCAYRHDGSPVGFLTREGFAGSAGHPCRLRLENRCRG